MPCSQTGDDTLRVQLDLNFDVSLIEENNDGFLLPAVAMVNTFPPSWRQNFYLLSDLATDATNYSPYVKFSFASSAVSSCPDSSFHTIPTPLRSRPTSYVPQPTVERMCPKLADTHRYGDDHRAHAGSGQNGSRRRLQVPLYEIQA
mmetsp:Transcript_15524/g.23554  ORF Transcript_15524/g.23554 Transcript_15524/m.23554 type:complete len:146 (-) Transcript_15524:288-725(-)|eukprot:CAMPEP_0196144954 /NCGR_PEP_ID=MMETSP0910-20130528/18526_1 /TAXON_ID=49265 /ORGANISM="Thalassiosira rotula, Strain GSO102" /LENGTH=145 /DNA_ID=CAMNT_0041406755 /DNA_START=290 /DNA_END=727 /DNA_ORIENTATION=-